ncbi:hypothetical protein DFH11DRAFT_1553818 [Phellopilus nigrolimitatus]|nr:hypothetical protein DFH11DRAFT_1553818 [Phellopilus nigrolimitatus]
MTKTTRIAVLGLCRTAIKTTSPTSRRSYSGPTSNTQKAFVLDAACATCFASSRTQEGSATVVLCSLSWHSRSVRARTELEYDFGDCTSSASAAKHGFKDFKLCTVLEDAELGVLSAYLDEHKHVSDSEPMLFRSINMHKLRRHALGAECLSTAQERERTVAFFRAYTAALGIEGAITEMEQPIAVRFKEIYGEYRLPWKALHVATLTQEPVTSLVQTVCNIQRCKPCRVRWLLSHSAMPFDVSVVPNNIWFGIASFCGLDEVLALEDVDMQVFTRGRFQQIRLRALDQDRTPDLPRHISVSELAWPDLRSLAVHARRRHSNCTNSQTATLRPTREVTMPIGPTNSDGALGRVTGFGWRTALLPGGTLLLVLWPAGECIWTYLPRASSGAHGVQMLRVCNFGYDMQANDDVRALLVSESTDSNANERTLEMFKIRPQTGIETLLYKCRPAGLRKLSGDVAAAYAQGHLVLTFWKEDRSVVIRDSIFDNIDLADDYLIGVVNVRGSKSIIATLLSSIHNIRPPLNQHPTFNSYARQPSQTGSTAVAIYCNGVFVWALATMSCEKEVVFRTLDVPSVENVDVEFYSGALYFLAKDWKSIVIQYFA